MHASIDAIFEWLVISLWYICRTRSSFCFQILTISTISSLVRSLFFLRPLEEDACLCWGLVGCGDWALFLAELWPEPLALCLAVVCIGGGLGEREVLAPPSFVFIAHLDDLASNGLGKRWNADILTPMPLSSSPGKDEDKLSIVVGAAIPEENPYLPVAVVFLVRNSMSL